MEFMKSWITNITVVIIFTMLLDILLPNNDMKKFAKVIMGLLIILVVIQPFLMLKNIGIQFQSTMNQTAAYLDNNSESADRSIAAFQNSTALDLYKQKLEEEVKAIIKKHDELENSKLDISIEIENDINNEKFGSIKAIQVLVDKSNSAVQASTIEPVKINTETVINKKQGEYKWNNSKLSQDLSMEINDSLGLKETEILIEIQE